MGKEGHEFCHAKYGQDQRSHSGHYKYDVFQKEMCSFCGSVQQKAWAISTKPEDRIGVGQIKYIVEEIPRECVC